MEIAFRRLVEQDGALLEKYAKSDALSFSAFTGSHRFSFYQAVRVFKSFWRKRESLNINGENCSNGQLKFSQPALDGHISSMLGDISYQAVSESSQSNVYDEPEWTLQCNFFGLFGPNGPLPVHINDKVREQEILAAFEGVPQAGMFPDFINLFNDRMLSLFYDIWRMSEPAADPDSTENAFIRTLDGIAGNVSSLPPELQQLRTRHASRFSGGRPTAEGLQAVLHDWLAHDYSERDHKEDAQTDLKRGRLPIVNVLQNQARWLNIPLEASAYLHKADLPATAIQDLGVCSNVINSLGGRLGESAYLGAVMLDKQTCLVVEIVFDTCQEFRQAQCGSHFFNRLRVVLMEYLGLEYRVEYWCSLLPEAVPSNTGDANASLNASCELGFQAWLGSSIEVIRHSEPIDAMRVAANNTIKYQIIH